MNKRQKELALISRRVREIYLAEEKKNGLVVREAYYGDREKIQEFIGLTAQQKLQQGVLEETLRK
eukprot:CAMPEP_0176454962 /NCGR_PEP_ID=MMETSP0127-20121128/30310_1 /TAXON_ID=938130 /ORGANISM="Platyophrya macrostoma, Strain WH" /LENGTH=64 /DNA_ID=CAMNT_0017844441 /DNA_START=390 /DNA_END=581 /DNA_ORIENTATION=-